METVLVHISDLHTKEGVDLTPYIRSIRAAANELGDSARRGFVVVSGDVTSSGLSKEFDLAADFLLQLKGDLTNRFTDGVDLIVVPGNHDCDLRDVGLAREALIDRICTETGSQRVDDEVCEICTKVQDEFFEFRDKLHRSSALCRADRLLTVYDYDIHGHRLFFYCYNSAWVSRLRRDPRF
jgi:hypothetical protein